MKLPWHELKAILALFLAERRGLLLSGMLLAAATLLCGVALLGLSGWFITATAIAGLTITTALAFDVFAPSAGIRFLALARTAARYGERMVTHDATLQVVAGLRERLFRGWAAPGAAGTLAKRPARLLFRLTQDIDALDSLYLRVVVPLAGALIVTLTITIAFALMHPLAGLAAALVMLTALAVPIIAARASTRSARLRAHGLEAIRSRAIDLVAGQTELIMAGRLASARDAVCDADQRLGQADDRLNRIETRAGFALGMLGALLLAGCLPAMAWLVEQGRIDAPVAALGLLIALAALEPFLGLRRGAGELGRTLLAARRVAPRLQARTAGRPLPLPAEGLALRLDGVSVRHEGGAQPVLRDISLQLRSGEILALVGPSGAGKSSLLSLLAGEVPAEAGHVETLPATLMTQRTELFQDDLRGNLTLAAPLAKDADLLDALAAAGLGQDVLALPDGLDTRLGEGGHGLSGGQSRRLALARLFLRNAPLWLLDEPTEGLDGSTAREILARLKAMGDGHSIVIATHIRREADIADRIALIEGGRIKKVLTQGEAGFQTVLTALKPD